MTQPWWKTIALNEMTTEQWESLCDGCARCCLIKLQDDETDDLYLTNVACRHLDLASCRCKEYTQRKTLVPSCVTLSVNNIESELYYMPESCAYKRLWLGQDLPHWHPLLGGNPDREGMTVGRLAILETQINEEDLEDHIIEQVVTCIKTL